MSAGRNASPSVQEHREAGPETVRCAVLTVSDTRTEKSDRSGGLIMELLVHDGHLITHYRIVPDDPALIRECLTRWTGANDVEAILTNGGTGIAGRDTTYDAVSAMLDKRLDGFGELFRMLSYEEIGAAAMMSRAVAGTIGGRFVVAMPGSTNAVRLAMERLILPELRHVVFELRK